MNTLGIDDFFYVSDKSYDFLAEKSLPSYHEAHQVLIAALCQDKDSRFDVIDLGIGSGVTSAYILKNYPHARVFGVDLFEEMLDDARGRLVSFGERVKLVLSDNTEYLKQPQNKVQVIVSAFCIHHLDEAGKKELFKLIYDSLLPGGRFLMLDLTTFDDPCVRKLARDATIRHMKENVKDEEYRQSWIHHWNEINLPHPADRMATWMRELGFSNVEIIFRNMEVAMLGGVKE